jgi:hypothetical protein
MRMYAPPKSIVSDPLEAFDRHKPDEVGRAVLMLWGSLAVGVLNVLFQPGLVRPEEWVEWMLPAAAFALVILLTASISAGHNWARITFLVFFAIGTLPYLATLREIFAVSALFGVLSLVQALLQLGALFLVFFKPGSLWFRRKESRPAAG